LEPNQNPNENKKTLPITEYLTPTNLSLGSLALGVLTLILVFFPDTKVLTIILGIIALLLGIYSYYTTNGSLISIIGIITSTIPLLFFLYLKLTWIYFEAERPFFL
jgi:membrane-bound ClpP family serine protease